MDYEIEYKDFYQELKKENDKIDKDRKDSEKRYQDFIKSILGNKMEEDDEDKEKEDDEFGDDFSLEAL